MENNHHNDNYSNILLTALSWVGTLMSFLMENADFMMKFGTFIMSITVSIAALIKFRLEIKKLKNQK